jgi:CheY-like chemotaxis protein
VDDEPDIRGMLQALLELRGFEVEVASDGVDALGKLADGLEPEVIILDLMMPRGSGWDFCRAQADDPRLAEIPVIVISGDSNVAVTAEELGVAGCLRKPIGAKDLIDAIQRHIR